MKKSLIAVCLLSGCALSSFAQTPANAAGAKLIAEHDAAYAKAHPAADVKAIMPMTHHAVKRHAHRTMHRSMKKVTK